MSITIVIPYAIGILFLVMIAAGMLLMVFSFAENRYYEYSLEQTHKKKAEKDAREREQKEREQKEQK